MSSVCILSSHAESASYKLKYTSSEPPSSKLCQLVGALKMSCFTGSSSLPSPQTHLGALSPESLVSLCMTQCIPLATHQWVLLEYSKARAYLQPPLYSLMALRQTYLTVISFPPAASILACLSWPLLICKSMHYVILTVFLETFLCFWKHFCTTFFGGERAYPSTQRLLERGYMSTTITSVASFSAHFLAPSIWPGNDATCPLPSLL